MPAKFYDFKATEAEAQHYWQQNNTFVANDNDAEDTAKKFYCLSMFPYPSGHLHMGHVRCYTLSDVIARYQRLCGKNVLHPMGWDAFGLPAENAAIKHQIAPSKWTRDNISNMRQQLVSLGISFDWTREFATCDPEYYRWEQWFFKRLFEANLVYRKSTWVNWDPVDATVLSNEQVIDGRGWRSGALVERKKLSQWFFRITNYAEELLSELDNLPGWSPQIKNMQRNWIGRSEGVEISFEGDNNSTLTVYTTRPDTLMGATFMAISTEHPWAAQEAETNPKLDAFIRKCRKVKMSEAEIATQEKLGMSLAKTVKHPLTGARIPVWVANFILMEYGSGATMCVPGHDQRDWDFARKYDLPIIQVIAPENAEECDLNTAAFVAKGTLINSAKYNGLSFADACDTIIDSLEKSGHGKQQTQYRLRDWSVSRQRYWGCPIPIVYCDDCEAVVVPDEQLPVLLPEYKHITAGKSPLTEMESFYSCCCPKCGRQAVRETDTFDTFVESSWYYARFACATNSEAMLDSRVSQWTPVDLYVGGIEHALLHLLYARFFNKAMRDLQITEPPLCSEPFKKLMLIGMVLKDGKKMSKSSGGVTSPSELMEKWGSDAVRLAVVFAAPPEQSFEWLTSSVEGASRFLKRLWNLVDSHVQAGNPNVQKSQIKSLGEQKLTPAARHLRYVTHCTLQQIQRDYSQRMTFNTVVAGVMGLCNEISKFTLTEPEDNLSRQEALEVAVQSLAPIAPHICHELWHKLGYEQAVAESRWLIVDPKAMVRDSFNIGVQVNGKLRCQLTLETKNTEEEIRQMALQHPNVERFIKDKTVRKVIHIPQKLLNIVV